MKWIELWAKTEIGGAIFGAVVLVGGLLVLLVAWNGWLKRRNRQLNFLGELYIGPLAAREELSDAIAAVESTRRAVVEVAIPQGEKCEGCWLYESDDQGTGCRNGEKPEGEALLNDINGNEDNWGDYRPSWCRSLYGEVKK